MRYMTCYIDSTWNDNEDSVYYGSIGYIEKNRLSYLTCNKIHKENGFNPEASSILDIRLKLIDNFKDISKFVIFTDSMIAIKQLKKFDTLTVKDKIYEFIYRYTQGHFEKDYNWYCDRLAEVMSKEYTDDIWCSWI